MFENPLKKTIDLVILFEERKLKLPERFIVEVSKYMKILLVQSFYLRKINLVR